MVVRKGHLCDQPKMRKVRIEAEGRGLVKRHKIGNAECMLFRARPVVGIYEAALRTDPYSLFGVKRGGI